MGEPVKHVSGNMLHILMYSTIYPRLYKGGFSEMSSLCHSYWRVYYLFMENVVLGVLVALEVLVARLRVAKSLAKADGFVQN